MPKDVICLDFEKEFDKVTHKRLDKKLQTCGIEGMYKLGLKSGSEVEDKRRAWVTRSRSIDDSAK